MTTCYQCDEEVNYLFADSRCGDCTRLTPEELRGEEEYDCDEELGE